MLVTSFCMFSSFSLWKLSPITLALTSILLHFALFLFHAVGTHLFNLLGAKTCMIMRECCAVKNVHASNRDNDNGLALIPHRLYLTMEKQSHTLNSFNHILSDSKAIPLLFSSTRQSCRIIIKGCKRSRSCTLRTFNIRSFVPLLEVGSILLVAILTSVWGTW